ncbi:MAG: response regulator transcription factor [Blautia sp.]|jgi:two-component system response regulator YesN
MMKLVIVEDEDIIREGLISYVDWAEMGYEVVGEAMDGKMGLDIIREKKPDVVLTDIRMPVMDGLQMLGELRKEKNDTSVVILSGYEDFEYARSAMKLGVSEYILKPLNIKKLQDAMVRIYEEHATKKQRREEFERLKKEEDYNHQQLRMHLITQVLQHRKMGEVREDLLEEMDNLYFSVLIVAQESFPIMLGNDDYLQMAEADKDFETAVLSVLRGFEHVLCVRTSMSERMICQWDTDKEKLSEAHKRLQQKFKDTFGKHAHGYLCSGKTGSGLHGLENICKKARQKQKEQYLKELNEIVRVESDKEGNFRYMSYNSSGLFAEVKTGTYEAIDRELDYFEHEMEKQKVVSHMHVLLLVSNLYSELMKLPEEVSGTAEEIFGDPMEYYKKIVTNTNRKEIIQYLKEVCHKLNDFFKNMNQGKFENILKRAMEYMQKEYANPALQIRDVAKAAYVSNSYLSIIIKQGTGKTFVEYLTELRMEQAKKLLKETELKSYEIAELCGFSNPTYFSTVFKSAYGMSPSAYKKANKNV